MRAAQTRGRQGSASLVSYQLAYCFPLSPPFGTHVIACPSCRFGCRKLVVRPPNTSTTRERSCVCVCVCATCTTKRCLLSATLSRCVHKQTVPPFCCLHERALNLITVSSAARCCSRSLVAPRGLSEFRSAKRLSQTDRPAGRRERVSVAPE